MCKAWRDLLDVLGVVLRISGKREGLRAAPNAMPGPARPAIKEKRDEKQGASKTWLYVRWS